MFTSNENGRRSRRYLPMLEAQESRVLLSSGQAVLSGTVLRGTETGHKDVEALRHVKPHPPRPRPRHHPRKPHHGSPTPSPVPTPTPVTPDPPILFPPILFPPILSPPTDANPTPTQPNPPLLSVSPTHLTFNATVSSTLDPPAQFFHVSNLGGGTPTVTEKPQQPWISLYDAGAVNGGESIGVQLKTIGMSPGTYNGTIIVSTPGSANGDQVVSVTLILAAPVFKGQFIGYVENDDSKDNNNDPGDSFRDPYLGTITMTATGDWNNFTLTFQGSLTNAHSAEEDFTTDFGGRSYTGTNIGDIRFKLPMGDGWMVVKGAFDTDARLTTGTFFGTWQFTPYDDSGSDLSDSGSGNFSLSA